MIKSGCIEGLMDIKMGINKLPTFKGKADCEKKVDRMVGYVKLHRENVGNLELLFKEAMDIYKECIAKVKEQKK